MNNSLKLCRTNEPVLVSGPSGQFSVRCVIRPVMDAENPRFFSNGRIYVFHPKKQIGDPKEFRTIPTTLSDIINRTFSEDVIIDGVIAGEVEGVSAKKEEDGRVTFLDANGELWCKVIVSDPHDKKMGAVACVDMMTNEQKLKFLQKHGKDSIVIEPVYLYNRGSTKLFTYAKRYPFDSYDTCFCGITYITKQTGIDNGLWDEKDPTDVWRKEAEDILSSELSKYESWLNGYLYRLEMSEWRGLSMSRDEILQQDGNPVYVDKEKGEGYWGIVDAAGNRICGVHTTDNIDDAGNCFSVCLQQEINKKECHIGDGKGFKLLDDSFILYGMDEKQLDAMVARICKILDCTEDELTFES